MMELDEKNPWLVADWNEFLYYCCPECPLKDHSKEEFINHALEFHPKAKSSLKTILFEEKNNSILQNLDVKISENRTEYPAEKIINNDVLHENDCSNDNDPDMILYKREAIDENEEENVEFDDFYEETETNFDHFGKTREIKSEDDEISTSNDPTITTNIPGLQNQTVVDKRKYNCTLCDKSYTQSHNLKLHHKNVHEGKKEQKSVHEGIIKRVRRKNHICIYCGSAFTEKSLLDIHLQDVHEGQTNNRNSEEPPKIQGPPTEVDIVNHEIKTEPEIAFEDSECSISDVQNQRDYYKKILEGGKTKYKCLECNKTHRDKSNLNAHIRQVHEGERNQTCSTCGKAFFQPHDLKRHVTLGTFDIFIL